MPEAPVLIETRALSRFDAARQTLLLQPTDFSLRGGERLAITGASGAGKSVFLRALAWLDEPGSGQLLWNGQALSPAQIPRYRSQVCYLAQRPALLSGSVEDNLRLAFTLSTHKHQRYSPASISALLAIAGKAESFLSKNAADLSGGEAQIVALIRTLQLHPQVLLLDEPTAALDGQSALAVETMVEAWFQDQANSPRACVWISHDPTQAARISNRMLTMQTGQLSEVEAA